MAMAIDDLLHPIRTGAEASRRGAERAGLCAIPAAAALLLWPALWNGFPIVFADTGTYLSQAIHLYAGWDRPVFYSLFMLPLHATVTVWPVVAVQALLTAWVLWLVVRTLAPRVSPSAFVAGTAALSVCTCLPWLVSELMPDLFTPLLVLALCLLGRTPERLSARERAVMAALSSFMIAAQISSQPLAAVLTATLLLLPRLPGFRSKPPRGRALLLILPPVVAVLALCTVNLAAHRRFATSPFGNIFLLARVIYDGPGMATLRRDCPARTWRLCPFLNELPATSDDFLWNPDSPLYRAGGPKLISADADAIIETALRTAPAAAARATLANTIEQLTRFDSGDGLNPWPVQVTPWIRRDFPPREQAAYAAARQQTGTLTLPPPLQWLHRLIALAGVAACALLLPLAVRRRSACAGVLLIVLLALPLSAAITGGLSAPHDRYQARIMWLAPFVAMLSLAELRPGLSARPNPPA